MTQKKAAAQAAAHAVAHATAQAERERETVCEKTAELERELALLKRVFWKAEESKLQEMRRAPRRLCNQVAEVETDRPLTVGAFFAVLTIVLQHGCEKSGRFTSNIKQRTAHK